MRREVRLALTVMDDLDLVNGDSLARCKGALIYGIGDAVILI
jgi:hypothetical protein